MKKEHENVLLRGRISEMQRKIYTIEYDQGSVKAQLSGHFYKKTMDKPVVGDYVLFYKNTNGISLIKELLKRKSILKRPDQSGHLAGYVKTMKEQVLAANFDYVFIMDSLNQNYNINRIMRYITTVLQSGAKPVVVLTKADLCDNPDYYVREVKQVSKQTDVFAISAVTGEGLEALKPYMREETTIVFIGSSGVGKSTLVNAMAGKEIMKTSQIRVDDAKGRHTTTHRQLITYPSGVTIIDSPGIREIGMCDVEEGIEHTFPDILELKGQCRFSDCKHKTEPGCAIKQALADGTLSRNRWNLYCNLTNENDWGTEKLARRR
ncbi:ribosome small subunit-dependent GTPase A [Anaerosporobacter faecicola]|uniref:ribosome small subunit-dependent GTPase A n=1 Tax=Anaerosporobacter faecicola TaxID=2718714 RepID=UPI001438BE69|nr:ribosome small subunit-dependent GTPase A [Anaerosporobacter faecicola]